MRTRKAYDTIRQIFGNMNDIPDNLEPFLWMTDDVDLDIAPTVKVVEKE